MVVAPFHRVIDADNRIADFRNTVRRVDEIVAEVFPGQFGGHIGPVEHDLQCGGRTVIGLLAGIGDGCKSGLAGRSILHGVIVDNQFNRFALGILVLFVKTLFGLVAKPFEFEHLVHKLGLNEHLPHLIVRNRRIKVLRHVRPGIQAHQIESSEDG